MHMRTWDDPVSAGWEDTLQKPRREISDGTAPTSTLSQDWQPPVREK